MIKTAWPPIFLSVLMAFLLSWPAVAKEQPSIEAVKSAYIYNFLKYITWPNEGQLEAIRIGFIGNDEAFFEACLRIQDQSIRNKTLVVHRVREPKEIKNYHVIVTSKDQNSDLKNIARVLYGQTTLLVSDDAKDKQLTMVNFTYPDSEYVRFEVNSYNMLYEKLKVSADIYLLGGNELDIANLLRDMEIKLSQSQSVLRAQTEQLQAVKEQVGLRESELAKQAIELDSVQKQVISKEREIEDQNKEIQTKSAELESQRQQLDETTLSLELLRGELNKLEAALISSRDKLTASSSLLEAKQSEIAQKESSITELSGLIDSNKRLLEEQNAQINAQRLAIEQQEGDLVTQSQALEGQRSTIKVQAAFIVGGGVSLALVAVIALMMFRNNRTKQRANAKLEEANQRLRDTQGQLVESEKMAALGGLVAGVAHEINTPLGVSVTAASHLEYAISNFNKQYQGGSLKRSELELMLSDANESTSMLVRNLHRASELIGNFKRVAADQTADEIRRFELSSYLNEVCQSLQPKLKPLGHAVMIDCPDIMMSTYPGALAQVVTNLVMNSVAHGFQDRRNGLIALKAKSDSSAVSIIYSDDGCGIKEDQMDKIFDPFYTTGRSRGGTGLGLHISYNLVTQRLQGTIRCQPSNGGARFIITIPIKLLPEPEN